MNTGCFRCILLLNVATLSWSGCAPSPSIQSRVQDAGLNPTYDDTQPPSRTAPDSQVMDDSKVPEMDSSSFVPQNSDLPTVCSTGFSAISAGAVPSYQVLSEVSGVVASRQRSELLWMHNDSGGEPILYAVGTDGAQRGRYSVPGDAIDWEDLALATCPDGVGECIWVGDIGDNRRVRTSVNILVVPEPLQDGDSRAERVWTFQLQYQDGPIDAEALVVHPEGQHLWIIEKRDEGTTRVFSHTVGALNDEEPTRLSPIVEFPSPGVPIENGRMVTGADLHPGGEHLLVRVYSGIYLYVLAEPFALNTLGQVEPRTITLGPLTEPQGEAIGYDHMGLGFWTISENPNRSGPMALNYFSCLEMPTNN